MFPKVPAVSYSVTGKVAPTKVVATNVSHVIVPLALIFVDDVILLNCTFEPVDNPFAIALTCVPTFEKSIPVCPVVSLNVNVLALILVLNEELSFIY